MGPRGRNRALDDRRGPAGLERGARDRRDVVFYGTLDGWFKAVDARDGRRLWQYRTSSGIVGQPVSYRGTDGKQYVAVLAGVGGWAGAVVAADLDVRDGSAAGGFAGALPDLKYRTVRGGMLYVFALP
jgi:outer membrane protein assembly factor BamB